LVGLDPGRKQQCIPNSEELEKGSQRKFRDFRKKSKQDGFLEKKKQACMYALQSTVKRIIRGENIVRLSPEPVI
jgi:hypothetical protein